MFRPSLFDGRRSNVEWHSCRTRYNNIPPQPPPDPPVSYEFTAWSYPTHTYSRRCQTSRVAATCTTSAIVRLPTGRSSFMGTLSSIPTFRAAPMFLLTLVHTHSVKIQGMSKQKRNRKSWVEINSFSISVLDEVVQTESKRGKKNAGEKQRRAATYGPFKTMYVHMPTI